MKKGKITKILTWLVGSLVGLVVIASVAVGFLDWNQYRGRLASLISEQTGMRVELAGDIRLGLLPRPSMSAEQVRMFPMQDGVVEPVATAELIEARLGISALLKGGLDIQHLGLNGLAVTLEERENGSINLRGWPEAPAEDEVAETAAPIKLNRLELQGGKITLMNADGTTRVFEEIQLDFSGSLPDGPFEWEGGLKTAGQQVTTVGKLRPSREEGVTSVKVEAALAGGSADISGRLDEGGFAGRVQVGGDALGRFVAAATAMGTGTPGSAMLPNEAFELDLQVERTSGVTRVTSRTFKAAETQGRVDLTLAERTGKTHVGGTLSLGIVDLQPWMDAVQQASGSPSTEQASNTAAPPELPVSGSIDVTIEGVRVLDGLIQQVDFALGVGDAGLFVGDAQALFPGATSVNFSGRIGADMRGSGNLNATSGNLQDMLRWLGYDPSGQLAPGRLATADFAGKLELDGSRWLVSNIKSRLDTTNISGGIVGTLNGGWPTNVTLQADNINLDAYLPENKPASAGIAAEPAQKPAELFAMLPESTSRFGFKASAIQWAGQSFRDFSVDGQVANSGVKVNSLTLKGGKGTLQLAAQLRPAGSDIEIDGDAKLVDWPMPFVLAVMPDMQPFIRASGMSGFDGSFRLSGPLSNLHLSANASNGEARQIAANGTVAYVADSPLAFDIRGTLKHENLRALASQTGFEINGGAAADLTFSASQKANAPIKMDISGEFAGGQLLAKGEQGESRSTWQVTYDHKRAQAAARKFLPAMTVPNPAQPLRVAANVSLSEGAWALETLDVRNGDAQIAGNVGSDNKSRLYGRLRGSGFVFNNLTGNAANKQPAPAQEGEPFNFEALRGYSGQVDLALEGVTLAGQKVQAPGAALTAGDGLIRLDLGSSALLNGQPVTVAVDLDVSGTPTVQGNIVVKELDIASMLLSEGFGRIADGVASFNFNFNASGETLEAMLGKLRGRGEITGRAGALNFLSVPSLVREMSQASTPTGFLTSIGGFLRQGKTNFAALETRFTLDGGVALVETLSASGPWGALSLDGQVNFSESLMDLKGQLNLTSPQDAPVIPVKYSGSLNNPSTNWTSRALESFVIAGIERRIRTSLFKEQENREATTGEAANNPAGEVFSRAFGFLNNLKKAQEEKKKKEAEAKKAEEEKDGDGT